MAALFIAANLALGLVFSTIAKTQQQAMHLHHVSDEELAVRGS